MKIIAINGGPRPNHNTGTLLKEVVNGATSKGAEVEVIDLYKLNYKGCIACMSCKRKQSNSLHNCAVKDDLTPVLEKIKMADAVVLASPIYFYDVTGEMRSFIERLLYPYLPYDASFKDRTYFPKKLNTAFIYTMGLPEGVMSERLKTIEDFISQIFKAPVKTLYSYSNYPFVDNFKNYEASDLSLSIQRREEVFPIECKKAFEFGVELVTNNK